MANEDPPSGSLDQQEDGLVHGGACTTCRRKKQKCSREDPCRSCVASNSVCIYEEGQRRGAKPGYIESLVKRMDTLESLVLGQSLLFAPQLTTTNGVTASVSNLEENLRIVRQQLLNPRKRPRTGSSGQSSQISGLASAMNNNATDRSPTARGSNADPQVLPPPSMLHELVEIYFAKIHPWIPILHQPSFHASMQSADAPPSDIVLQAITAATIKFYNVDSQTKEWYHQRCHDAVVLACMDRFSVESLQASIILAFNTIGNGRGPRSWSIVASATRIVEQLGLAVEEEDAVENKLLNRIGFLPPAKNWTEAESLRRIFWCIFLMDRFCSVSTGWNTSLTGTDVKRRLPVEGCFWRDRVEKKGRYFNIANHSVDPVDETDALGGFAYLIEATECLCRVATFLLQEGVDISSNESLRRWFETFQSLDAMLVRWKTFLPARWQVAGIDATGKMDENLTLAHITHNTSVIMLHQNIAYPDTKFRHRLPSLNAAKTCVVAANEIATIAAKFIANTTVVIPPALSFCLFIAARALLADSKHFGTYIDPNFESLLQCLREASKRWKAGGLPSSSENLAGQFADRITAAWRSGSPINVRSVALQEDGAPPMSLASPLCPTSSELAPSTHHLYTT
ncbi:Citrinin biosynthesis transcriptional activator ctnR-like protein [Cladobotryum mycophilum]|uniref:Citrinin biosynthesis transcriptional activator ctnR-like protein n=1 Tax=Cladobotryum mycophilum TaxID=491253 RepID=A0ABR0STF6_9HYPO